jgi:hypothetical protein
MCLYIIVAGSLVASWKITGGEIVWPALSKPLGLAVFWLLVLLAKPITPPEALPHGRG